MHKILYDSYIALTEDPKEALENAKLALKHAKQVEDKKWGRSAYKSLAIFFSDTEAVGEALISGEKRLSYFEENDDSEDKRDAQWTMTSTYYKRALNYLNNKQFKEASDDGEQALVY
ncbi:hypothetical protein QN277_026962 [Acacia crassicarpa]|uniref:Uncharacterized protein n=1 Tax=Acacia crassicarpa TaxID=499986 RepID=A0AAE1K585_9FABA|nr:hypothetical protein QN277_026962 [Acacia crassicarpa]